jgi:hypothetical protein
LRVVLRLDTPNEASNDSKSIPVDEVGETINASYTKFTSPTQFSPAG